jgi:hypothetical protein
VDWKEENKQKWVRKLAKAQLSIVTRNCLNYHLSSTFQGVRMVAVLPSQKKTSDIPFFKHKKEQRIHEHKTDGRVNKLKNLSQLVKVLQRMFRARMNTGWLQLRRGFQPKQQGPSRQGDSLEIMSNVVRHMIYLTGRNTDKSKHQQTATH